MYYLLRLAQHASVVSPPRLVIESKPIPVLDVGIAAKAGRPFFI
jgi:hypothetical protein